MDFEKRVKMRFAMQRHIQSCGLELKENPMDGFTKNVDYELRSKTPPSSAIIVSLYLLLDTDFMVAHLKRNHGFRGQRGMRYLTIAGISHDPYNPLYPNVQHAFDWAQQRRKLAGFPPDPWPMKFESSSVVSPPRRLVWNPVMSEIKEACKMYRRYVREGFRPFSVDSQGDPLVPVDLFDPQAGEIMFQVGE